MNEPLDPLSPELAALFELERPNRAVSPEATERMLSGIKAAVPAETLAAVGRTPPVHPSGVGRRLAAKLSTHLLTLGLGAAAGSTATYAVLHAKTPAPSAQVLTHPATAPAPTAAPTIAPAPIAPAPRPTAPSAPTPTVAPPAKVQTARRADLDLAEEKALVQRARMALARGDGASALAATEEHRRRFLQGTLSEERDALHVQALVDLKRLPEAKAAAQAFHGAYPDSLFAPVVDGALDGP